MPERETNSTPNTPKPTIYVSRYLGIIEDDNNGKLKVKMEGDTEVYVLSTRPFKGSKCKKYSRKILGKYTRIYYENDFMLEEVARLITGW